VIVTNPGWTKQLVETHSCGWYVPAERPGALADRLLVLADTPDDIRNAGIRGAQLARARFDRRDLASELETVLVRAAGSQSSGRSKTLSA
jgi:hypothetical protein